MYLFGDLTRKSSQIHQILSRPSHQPKQFLALFPFFFIFSSFSLSLSLSFSPTFFFLISKTKKAEERKTFITIPTTERPNRKKPVQQHSLD